LPRAAHHDSIESENALTLGPVAKRKRTRTRTRTRVNQRLGRGVRLLMDTHDPENACPREGGGCRLFGQDHAQNQSEPLCEAERGAAGAPAYDPKRPTIVRRSSQDVVVFEHTATGSARVGKSTYPIYYLITSSAATGVGGGPSNQRPLPTELLAFPPTPVTVDPHGAGHAAEHRGTIGTTHRDATRPINGAERYD
jgi:hypothetical protein